MGAMFNFAVHYWIEAVCKTPLRSGGPENNMEEVLRDSEGRPFLQGSSISGAMRNWMEQHTDPRLNGLAEFLFGARDKGHSHLIVSDALFDKDEKRKISTRPRLRINGKNGCADISGKFDVAHIPAGSQFHFDLVWLANIEEKEDGLSRMKQKMKDLKHAEIAKEKNTSIAAALAEVKGIEEILAALNSGLIHLGAQKTNGFGQITLTVKKRVYHLNDAEDRLAWLEEKEDGIPLDLEPVRSPDEIIFTVKGHADSILIKAACVKQIEGGGSVTGNLVENGFPILPGSSIKGVVRARAEAIAQYMKLDNTVVENLFGRGVKNQDNGKCGRVYFEDVLLQKNSQKITRIRVNRFTGGVFRKGLFSEEPVCSDVTLCIVLRKGQPAECGLLLYALRDLGLGLYNIGSGGAIGRGYLQVNEVKASLSNGDCSSLHFDEKRNCTIKDDRGLFQRWLQAIQDLTGRESV